VYRQPESRDEILEARAALAACPVAAIRVESLAERRHRGKTPEEKRRIESEWTDDDERLARNMALSSSPKSDIANEKPFPRPFLGTVPDVYWVGHHNEFSFGATPYLLKVPAAANDDSNKNNDDVWIMVDTPRYGRSAVEAVTGLAGPNGPDYLFLTHVDDTADHGKWADHFNNMKQVFHSGDLGRHNWVGDETLADVDILLQSHEQESKNNDALTAFRLEDGSLLPEHWAETTDAAELPVVILHTPGHSPGSITLYRRPTSDAPGILFTGDTYSFRIHNGERGRNGDGYMTGFPRYGNRLDVQSDTIPKFLDLDWDVVAPGHGHPRDYRDCGSNKRQIQADEMAVAVDELKAAHEQRTGVAVK